MPTRGPGAHGKGPLALVPSGAPPDDGRVTDTLSTVPDGTSPVRHHTWRVILIVLVVAILVIIGVIVFSGGSSGVTAEQQLASVRYACTQWSGNAAPGLGTTSASTACTTMADWMNEQLRGGQMSGPMMWSSSASLGATCRDWMSTESRASVSGTASPAWCDEMVGWMERHVDGWHGWMMTGNMMGGDRSGSTTTT
jgi:hypothetical protein